MPDLIVMEPSAGPPGRGGALNMIGRAFLSSRLLNSTPGDKDEIRLPRWRCHLSV